jgi:hypothetical protein
MDVEKFGITKIIYAPVLPETELALNNLVDGNIGDLKNSYPSEHTTSLKINREKLHSLYRDCWKGRQDFFHETFFEKWLDWSAPFISGNIKDYPFYYPTAGANEGIRESIVQYKIESIKNGSTPKIHVFNGEYEGYSYYADIYDIPVVVHNRDTWQDSIKQVGLDDKFYISQPSSIDGNFWEEFNIFSEALYDHCPTSNLMLDLTYVGLIPFVKKINIDVPNIQTIFFSLSKAFGVYYHRIGGCYSKNKLLGLEGNKWFKNILSLKLGETLMDNYDVTYIPKKYSQLAQHPSVTHLKSKSSEFNSLNSSDVWLIAIKKSIDPDSMIDKFLMRGDGSNSFVRICLTPCISKIINEKYTSFN